jgi:hypothetical protein
VDTTNNATLAWWRSPTRIIRRGAIGILSTAFFLNGLAKGGLTLLVLDVFLGGNWVGHHTWASIGIAFLVGGVLIPIPCTYLISKEDDARRAAARRPR